MTLLLNHPLLLGMVTWTLLWIGSQVGAYSRRLRPDRLGLDEEDFTLVLGATLTLLGLIIGFTFSMAVSRYDQRKNYEEQEANAIGTEYFRLDAWPAPDAVRTRSLLRDYLDQRIVYYTTRDAELLRRAQIKTSQLQSRLWSSVAVPATGKPDPISALVFSGMNDVLNSEGYTEAAWLNRVPLAAWILVVSIATFCNFLVGYRAHGKTGILFLIMPIALSISLFLIADIDSPRGGTIRVHPQNLHRLADSLRSQ
jgi:hypothetical protein